MTVRSLNRFPQADCGFTGARGRSCLQCVQYICGRDKPDRQPPNTRESVKLHHAKDAVAIAGSPFMRGGGVLMPVASDLLEACQISQARRLALFEFFLSGVFADGDQLECVASQLPRGGELNLWVGAERNAGLFT